jgi:hypothetical protein
MKYWKHKHKIYAIRVSKEVVMNPENWEEITKEEFNSIRGINE